MDISSESRIDVQNRFFNVPANAPKVVQQVAAALKRQNDIGGFIPELAKRDGYAVWDKSTITKLQNVSTSNRDGHGDPDDSETQVFTPVVQQDSGFVNGFFYTKIIGDSVELHLYRANDYEQYPYGKVDSSNCHCRKNNDENYGAQ